MCPKRARVNVWLILSTKLYITNPLHNKNIRVMNRVCVYICFSVSLCLAVSLSLSLSLSVCVCVCVCVRACACLGRGFNEICVHLEPFCCIVES